MYGGWNCGVLDREDKEKESSGIGAGVYGALCGEVFG